MACNVAIGEFTRSVNPITFTIGFEAKLIILFASYQTTYGAFSMGSNYFAVGVSIGTATNINEVNQFTEAAKAGWNTSAFFGPEAERIARGGEIISDINTGGLSDNFAHVSAITGTDFTVTFTLVGTAFRYQYMALGGDDLTVNIGTVAMPTVTGTQTITTTLRPDCYWLIGGRTGNSPNGIYYSLGVCDGTTRCGVTAWQQFGDQFGSSGTPSVVKSYQRTDRVLAVLDDVTGAVLGEAEPVSVSTGNFVINWTTAPAVTQNYKYIAVNFGQLMAARVGSFAQPASTGLQTIPVTGITPEAIWFQTSGLPASTAVQNDQRFAVGLGSITTNLAVMNCDVTNIGSMANRANARYSSNSRCVVHGHATAAAPGTIDALALLNGVSIGSFDLLWTQVDTTPRETIFLAFQQLPIPVPPPIPGIGGHWRTRIGSTFRAWTVQPTSGPTPDDTMTLIETQSPIGAGSVTFAALGTFTDLQLRWIARSTDAAISVNLQLRFNGDASAVYYSERIQAIASAITATEGLAATIAPVASVAGGGAAALMAGSGIIDIQDYRGSTFQKTGVSLNACHRGVLTNNMMNVVYAFAWRNASPITSITVSTSAGNFVAGSKFSLYGIL